MMKKRLWSVVLVLALCLTMLPTVALAAETDTVSVAGVELSHGDYLATGSSIVQTTKPAGGYAHLEKVDGTLILTLHDYSYTGEGYRNENVDYDNGAIYSDLPLTIMLEGSSSLTTGMDENQGYASEYYDGIVMLADLTIDGTGSLTIHAGDDAIDMYDGYLTINSGDLTMITDDDGFCMDEGDVTINGGTLTMDVDDEGINADEYVIIYGGIVKITAGDDGIDAGQNLIVDGGKVAIAAGDQGVIVLEAYIASGGLETVGGTDPEKTDTYGLHAMCLKMTGGYLLAKNVSYVDSAPAVSAEYTDFADGFELDLQSEQRRVEIGVRPADMPTITGDTGFYILDVLAGAAGSYNPFVDVTADAWYHDAVVDVYKQGLMTGTDYNKFDPNATTTRAMIVTILWRLEGSPMGVEASGFSDNDLNSWYGYAVEWAAAFDIVEGADGKFSPNAPITREQLAAILFRYAKYKGYDVWYAQAELGGFTDATSVSGYAAEAMEWAVGEGLITGANEALMPGGSATRAQVAAILSRFLSK